MTELSTADFEFISRLVKVEAAISLEKGKEYLVQSRLEPVAKTLGLADISALVQTLRVKKDLELTRKVVESLTTHETSFFRDIEPFEALRTSVLPELISSRRDSKELTIWCGAASSGQEPYTLCMLIREHFPELCGWRLKILASDVSRPILNRARSGVFSQLEVNRGLPVRFLVKYFEKNGQEWIIKPEVRGMIEYFEFNLLHSFARIPSVDLVMLRNVLIYFDMESKRQILAKIRSTMKPSGYLFLGTAETTMNVDESFERVTFQKTSCYKKKS